MPRQHHITPILKPIHWLNIPEELTSKSYHYLKTLYNTPCSHILPNYLPSAWPALPDHLSRSISTSSHYSSHVLQPRHIPQCTTPLKQFPFWIKKITDLSLASLPINLQAFHSKPRCHLFKTSYPESSNTLPSHPRPVWNTPNNNSATRHRPPLDYHLDNPPFWFVISWWPKIALWVALYPFVDYDYNRGATYLNAWWQHVTEAEPEWFWRSE